LPGPQSAPRLTYITGDITYLAPKNKLASSGNIILREEITPECAIYLPADNPKPSAETAIKKADIIRGEPVPVSKRLILAERLGCEEAVIQKIVELSGAIQGQG